MDRFAFDCPGRTHGDRGQRRCGLPHDQKEYCALVRGRRSEGYCRAASGLVLSNLPRQVMSWRRVRRANLVRSRSRRRVKGQSSGRSFISDTRCREIEEASVLNTICGMILLVIATGIFASTIASMLNDARRL
jgi:hypothetical protein